MFDLTLIPFHLISGYEQEDLPGLLATAPPRRAERHRTSDQMMVLMTGPGGKALPESFCKQAFEFLSSTYYRASGTLTSALRTTIEQFNEYLLDLNQKAPLPGQIPVLLNLAILRGNMAYIAHVGPVHSFVLTQTAGFEFYDPAASGTGLGSGQTFNARFFQAEVKPGDLLLFAPEIPASWNSTSLAGTAKLTPEALRRRLLNQAQPDLRSGIIRLQEGKGSIAHGKLHLADDLPSTPAVRSPAISTPDVVQPIAQPVPAPSPQPQLVPVVVQTTVPQPATPQAAQSTTEAVSAEIIPEDEVISAARRRIEERRARQTSPKPEEPRRDGGFFGRPFRKQEAPVQTTVIQTEKLAAGPIPAATPVPSKPARRPWLKGLAAFFRGARKAQQRTEQGINVLVPRILPRESNQPITLSAATMFFIAIAIPVIVVVIATTVYFRSGATEQRQAYLKQAQSFADAATTQKDATLRRNAWTQTLYWINKAEEFGSDDQSVAMKHRAQVALDSMDGVVRLSLSPAFPNTLGNGVNITRIAATTTDLYLLDSSKGRVMHLILGGRSYEFDPNFTCGPGPSGGKIIGPLVGMATLPPNNDFKATVLAADSTGNILYCIPGETPVSKTLLQPENNWGKITSITLFNGNLYALDIQGNAVWRFDGENYKYAGRPRLFFGNEVPNLNDVVDMTVYQDDLYLLRQSGKMTMCTFSAYDFAPTRCIDPTKYGSRSGPVEVFKQAGFLQLQTTEPPDPSLFILDTKGPAIYHFSLRLNYQRQLRQNPEDDFPLPQKAVTAFAITPNRVVFLAFGNQIYFGALP